MSSFMVIDWAPDKTALNFGQVALGQQSPAQTITLTNHGLQGSASLPLYISSPSGDFSRVSSGQNDCGTTLSPQQSCTIAIVLTPTASGPRSGSFTIDGGDCAGDPRTISLSGNSTSSGQPDFVVTSISLSPTSPTTGGTFNATITVQNQGNAAGDGGYVDLWLNQPTSQGCGADGDYYGVVGTLAAGESKNFLIDSAAAGTAGGKTLRAFVDSACATAESNESNNQTTKSYTVGGGSGQPDFVVTSISLNPTSPTAGGTFNATVSVKNQGNAAGDGGYLDLWLNQPTSQGCGAEGDYFGVVGTMAAGESKNFLVDSAAAGTAGGKTLRAFVDSTCAMAESNESNNQTTQSYSVLPGSTTTYILTVNKTGSGTVSGPGIDCGNDCSESFDAGTQVTLTATPASGWQFSGWSGDCSGQGGCNLSMTAAKSVTATFTSIPVSSLGDAVDNTTLSWNTGGNAPWIRQAGAGPGGGDAARSATIGDGETSYMRTIADGPGWVQFLWRSSSELGFDYLRFSIDDVAQAAISGIQDWKQETFPLGEGRHVLVWSYVKDDSTKAAEDAAWLDAVKFEQAASYQLTLNLLNDGWIKSWPAGIDCRRQGESREGSCQAGFPPGTLVNLSPVNDGHSINAWGGACGGSAQVCTLPLIGHSGVTASFVTNAAMREILAAIGDTGLHPSLTIAVIGQGQVNAVLNGVEQLSGCRQGSPCYKLWPGAVSLVLTATPDLGNRFTGWEGEGCQGITERLCTVLVDAHVNIQARFEAEQSPDYLLQIQKTGQGSVTGGGALCTDSSCALTLPKDTSVNLAATANAGYSFNGWSGDCGGTNCQLSMTGPKEVTANFIPTTGTSQTLSVTPKPTHGTVHTPGADVVCGSGGSACAKNYPASTELILEAVADAGYFLESWGGACSGKSDCRVKMDGPKTLQASFAATPAVSYQLVVTSAAGGGISVTGQASCGTGQSCTYTGLAAAAQLSLNAVPASGYRFNGWEGDCAGRNNPCTLVMDQNHNTTALFATTAPKLSVYTSGSGAVSGPGINCGGDCTETYSLNQSIQLSAGPFGNSRFGGWSGACAGQGNPCGLQMGWDKNVIAQFIDDSANTATLSVNVTGSGSVISNESPPKISCQSNGCRADYDLWQIVKLYAEPYPGESFLNWGEACNGQGDPCSLSLSTDRTVTANFTQNQPPLTQINLSGKVLLSGTSIPVCAMVLANGQSQFSCDGQGNFNLASVPLDQNRQVTLYTWAEGFNPYKLVFTPVTSSEQRNVAMTVSPCGGVSGPGGSGPGTVTQLDISGQVLLNGTTIPVCAMVLANGQSQFSCDGAGNFHLTGVPVDQSGKVTLYSWAEGFLPYKDVFTPSGSSVSRTVLMRTNCAATETGR